MQKERKYYPAIDFIKAFAIISVVILHLMVFNGSKEPLFEMFTAFHIWQAVPLFMFVIGMTLRLSLDNGATVLGIFSNRMVRFLIPLLIAYVVAFIIRYIMGYHNSIDWHVFIGLIPTPGMGTYFITLYFETIVVLIVLSYLVKHYTFFFVLSIAVLFSIIGELIAFNIDIKDMYLYSSSIHRYIVLLVLGYYFFDFKYEKKYFLLIALMLLSTLLLIVFQSTREPIWPYSLYKSAALWQFQHFPYAFYTLLLASILIYMYNKIPKNIQNKCHFILYIGKASLHIFLVQIFVFFIAKQMQVFMRADIGFLIFTVVLFIGCLWLYIEQSILKRVHIDAG